MVKVEATVFSIPIPVPTENEWVAWVCVCCSTYSNSEGLRNQILICQHFFVLQEYKNGEKMQKVL